MDAVILAIIVFVFCLGHWLGGKSAREDADRELNWLRRQAELWFYSFRAAKAEADELKDRLSPWELEAFEAEK